MRMKPGGTPSPPHALQPWADFMDKVSIVVPHMVPLLGVLVLGWSAGAFLVLGLFQLSFSIMSIGVVGVAASTKREKPDVTDAGWADRIGGWVALGAIAVTGGQPRRLDLKRKASTWRALFSTVDCWRLPWR